MSKINNSIIKYRLELDGLRAIAVLAVIIYHAQIEINGQRLFPGGYIGVDVFFVISGYLICSILLTELNQKTFQLKVFYVKRIRRILPALVTVQLATIPFAYYLLYPDAFMEYAGSLVSTSLFFSNYYFMTLDSYVAQGNVFKPLLHTWSLAVEEQFYILFPLFLLLCFRYLRRYITLIFVSLIVVSLYHADSLSFENTDINTAFFLLTTRIWELVAGALLAQFEINKSRTIQNKYINDLLALIGIGLIFYSYRSFNALTQHPSLQTLVPIIGVMMVIWFTRHGKLIKELLSVQILRAIGLISYSLYLWHQPVFAFRRVTDAELSAIEIALLISVTFGLSILTYFVIEKPARNRQRCQFKRLSTVLITGLLITVSVGAIGYSSNGLPERYPPAIEKIFTQTAFENIPEDYTSCEYLRMPFDICQFRGEDPKKPGVVVIGDSHAAIFHNTILNTLSDYSYYIPKIYPGCIFQFDYESIRKDGTKLCEVDTYRATLDHLLRLDDPIVIISGRLPLHLTSTYFNNKEGSIEPGTAAPGFFETGQGWPDKISYEQAVTAITKPIQTLLANDIKVVLVYPVPEVGFHVPNKIAEIFRSKSYTEINDYFINETLSTSYKVFQERTRSSYELYDRIPDSENLIRIYPEELLCDGKRCYVYSNNTVLYSDDDHLSFAGASALYNHIVKKINDNWKIVL